jgi:diguanylate cyclase (GGDEF)-like protein
VPGVFPFSLLMLALTWWVITNALEAHSTLLADKILWAKASYLGVDLAPGLLLMFAITFTGQSRSFPRFWHPIIWSVPFLSQPLVWTNELHHWIWTGFTPVPGYNLVIYHHGWWFWVITIHCYLVNAAATYLFIHGLRRRQTLYRMQVFVVILALCLPWIASIIYVAGLSPLPGLDPAPVAFSITGLLIAVSINRLHFLDLLPAAREKSFEILADGMIVLDNRYNVLDINPAGRRMFHLEGQRLQGLPASELLPALFPFLVDGQPKREIELPGERTRYLELHVYPLDDPRGLPMGSLAVLHDYSSHKDTELDLKAHGEAMARLAITDELTQLHNRRYAEQKLSEEFARAEKLDLPLSYGICDIDLFKRVNDHYGHPCGDSVIQTVAHILHDGTRTELDVVARIGGEEFSLLFLQTDLQSARHALERLRRLVEQQEIVCMPETITFSAGVTTRRPGDTPDSLFSRADGLLLRAKAEGRNRVLAD